MKEDRAQLARKLKTRFRVSRVIAVIFPAALFASLVVLPWSIERIEFQQAKSGFAETWCATYGTDSSELGEEQWLTFIEEHRGFLEENFHALGIEAAEGLGSEPTRVLKLDYLLRRANGSGGFKEFSWFGEWFTAHFHFFQFPGGSAPKCG